MLSISKKKKEEGKEKGIWCCTIPVNYSHNLDIEVKSYGSKPSFKF